MGPWVKPTNSVGVILYEQHQCHGYIITLVAFSQHWAMLLTHLPLDFADDIFKCILGNDKFRILIKISLKFVPKVPIDNISELV